MALITITQPAVEPVSLADVKDAGRIDGTEFDAQLAILITAIRLQAEHNLGRRLITQTVELVLDAFPSTDDIDLLLPNAQSITSVKYYDAAGTQQTLDPAAYSLDSDSPTCWLLAVSDWPATKDVANAVRIRYVVGYGPAAADVPANVRLWIIANVLQALDAPSGQAPQTMQPMAYVDRLLDTEMVHRAA